MKLFFLVRVVLFVDVGFFIKRQILLDLFQGYPWLGLEDPSGSGLGWSIIL